MVLAITVGAILVYNAFMVESSVQELCGLGQAALERMDYLLAERYLSQAEELAWGQRDFDTLSRLYMPLQEARRQRRQRCGEGTVQLDLFDSPDGPLHPARILDEYPCGQFLLAGQGSIAPAAEFRNLALTRGLYAEAFLAAIYPTPEGQRLAIFPLADEAVPDARFRPIEQLRALLPAHSLLLDPAEVPAGPRQGSSETFSLVMSIWERLHLPFLAAADAETDLIRKIEAYRRTICVDYACELAHQKLSDAARVAARQRQR